MIILPSTHAHFLPLMHAQAARLPPIPLPSLRPRTPFPLTHLMLRFLILLLRALQELSENQYVSVFPIFETAHPKYAIPPPPNALKVTQLVRVTGSLRERLPRTV